MNLVTVDTAASKLIIIQCNDSMHSATAYNDANAHSIVLSLNGLRESTHFLSL